MLAPAIKMLPSVLPIELVHKIVELLDASSRSALLRVCRAVQTSLQQHVTFLNLYDMRRYTPLCFRFQNTEIEPIAHGVEGKEDGDKKAFGWTPFLISEVFLEKNDSDSSSYGRIKLRVVRPKFSFGGEKVSCPFEIDRNEVYLGQRYADRFWLEEDPGEEGYRSFRPRAWWKRADHFILDWVADCESGRKLIRATGRLMRRRERCMTCKDDRHVCPGGCSLFNRFVMGL